MANLNYMGAASAGASDLITTAYINALTAANLSQATVDSMVNSGLSPYVLKSYVDTQDALNATKAFIDAGDATRLHLSQIGVNSGVAGLDSGGRVEVSRLTGIGASQRWPKPFVSPAAYQAAAVTANSTTEVQLYTVAVADPGYTYRLLITGTVDASGDTDGQYPVVRVRQGSATGQLVAQGRGLAESYSPGLMTTYTAAGTATYTKPGGYTTFDIIALGAGGPSTSASTSGGAGKVGYSIGVANASVPATLAVVTGAGGTTGAGAASTVSGSGFTTLTGAGGAANTAGTVGASPGASTINGNFYQGGATSTGVANAPGGGAGPNNAGAPGAVWIFAYNTAIVPNGPVNVVPYPLNLQTPITGATTLYVLVARSGAQGAVTVSTARPDLYALPIPA